MGGITLKVAVQPALALRHGQFVFRLGKMVHAYVYIAALVNLFTAMSSISSFTCGAGRSSSWMRRCGLNIVGMCA